MLLLFFFTFESIWKSYSIVYLGCRHLNTLTIEWGRKQTRGFDANFKMIVIKAAEILSCTSMWLREESEEPFLSCLGDRLGAELRLLKMNDAASWASFAPQDTSQPTLAFRFWREAAFFSLVCDSLMEKHSYLDHLSVKTNCRSPTLKDHSTSLRLCRSLFLCLKHHSVLVCHYNN